MLATLGITLLRSLAPSRRQLVEWKIGREEIVLDPQAGIGREDSLRVIKSIILAVAKD